MSNCNCELHFGVITRTLSPDPTGRSKRLVFFNGCIVTLIPPMVPIRKNTRLGAPVPRITPGLNIRDPGPHDCDDYKSGMPGYHHSVDGLKLACKAGRLDQVRFFAEGRSPMYLTWGLHEALDLGHLEITRYLLSAGPFIDLEAPFIAARSLSIPIFESLLEYGWDVNNPGMGYRVVLRWFLKKGANPNLGAPSNPSGNRGPNENSGNTLNAAAGRASVAVIDMLLEKGARIDNSAALHHAVASDWPVTDRLGMISHLLNVGANINYVHRDEWFVRESMGTALHVAARLQRVQEAKLLLYGGADVETKARGGRNALDEAIKL
ncbi:ankyrin [Rhizodiscina lignyota]|uniref:Ankyrin n=1 Tax=Rhizodiscina lignyota TaxID=1504668 RepID=A0A9P4MGF1_9PEZI|nr:ankyrin [Rhizodiscina lignyota]